VSDENVNGEALTLAEVQELARELLENCDIGDIRPVEISAELVASIPRKYTNIGLETTSQYAVAEGVFRNRFGFKFTLTDDEDEPVAALSFTLIVEWAVEESYTPRQEAAEYVATTTGFFAAYPYARELAQSTASRLGLDPVLLGILNRNEIRPRAIGSAIRTPAEEEE